MQLKSSVDPRPEPLPPLAVARPLDPADRVDDEALFDFQQTRRFVAGALRRHWFIFVFTMITVAVAVAALAEVWPKSYEVDGRLLLQRNELMASLVNPGRTIPREAESPTLAAREIVLGRENVVALMKAANVLERWEETRAPLLRYKDQLMLMLGPAPTDDERIDALAGLIENRLQIGTSEEGAVSFFIRWPDPLSAYQLVDEAMKSFLEYRRRTETSAITESIAILDKAIADLESQITRTITQLPPRRAAQRSAPRRPPPVLAAGPSPQAVVQLSRLRSALDSRQQDVARLAGTQTQQLSEAQARLTAALAMYTDGHPTVVALRQTVTQLSRDSAELTSARREAQKLETEYDALSVKVGAATEAQSRSIAMAGARAAEPAIDPMSLVTIGDENEPVSLRLRVEMSQLAALRERANAARAELSSSQAGFKYRYTVTRPPRPPRRPSGPNVPLILLVGGVASVLLAIGAAVTMRTLGR